MDILPYLNMTLSSNQQKGLSERKYANALIISNRVIKYCTIRELGAHSNRVIDVRSDSSGRWVGLADKSSQSMPCTSSRYRPMMLLIASSFLDNVTLPSTRAPPMCLLDRLACDVLAPVDTYNPRRLFWAVCHGISASEPITSRAVRQDLLLTMMTVRDSQSRIAFAVITQLFDRVLHHFISGSSSTITDSSQVLGILSFS